MTSTPQGPASADSRRNELLLSFRQSGMAIVIDGVGESFRADLVAPAETVDGRQVAKMIEYSSGLVCAAVTDSHAARLELPDIPTASNKGDANRRFSVAVDAADGVTTGISARDRALTLGVLASTDSRPADLTRPGHVMVLRADPAGRGQAAAALRLCHLASLPRVAAIAPLMFDENDQIANREHTQMLAAILEVPVIDSADTRWNATAHGTQGEWKLSVFDADCDVVCVRAFGRLDGDAVPLIGIRGRCLDSEVGGSAACRCGLEAAAWTRTVEQHGAGAILVYRDRYQRCVDRPAAELARIRFEQTKVLARVLGIYRYRILGPLVGGGTQPAAYRGPRSANSTVMSDLMDFTDGSDPYIQRAV
ncbi:MAG: hypothetical protein C0482_16735 [Gordonia sp.]|nr:hypothetical protein [Gordonia sp. (in: high G+C Gram-positive bacteria)]